MPVDTETLLFRITSETHTLRSCDPETERARFAATARRILADLRSVCAGAGVVLEPVMPEPMPEGLSRALWPAQGGKPEEEPLPYLGAGLWHVTPDGRAERVEAGAGLRIGPSGEVLPGSSFTETEAQAETREAAEAAEAELRDRLERTTHPDLAVMPLDGACAVMGERAQPVWGGTEEREQ